MSNQQLFANFIQATRPRTYPLALSGIMVGNAVAFSHLGEFSAKNWQIFILTLWVALGLQILSNLANDYGDGIKGTDNHRTDRQTAQGNLSHQTLKTIIIGWAIFIFACGVILLNLSFDNKIAFWGFLGLGILAIISAITYTVGKKPYGYHGKGEISVFIFFGLVSVLGSVYLQTQTYVFSAIFLAIAIGLFCSCVLMINNMRDIDTDKQHQKNTLAVKLGKQKIGYWYHLLLISGLFMAGIFAIFQQNYGFLALLILLKPIKNHLMVVNQYRQNDIQPEQIAPQLKTIVGITLISSLIMSFAMIYQHYS